MKRKLSIDNKENEMSNGNDEIIMNDVEAVEDDNDGLDKLATRKRKLQEQLRNHEATLILLKKIRSSQIAPQLSQNNASRKVTSTNSSTPSNVSVVKREVKQNKVTTPPVQRTQKFEVSEQNRTAAKLALRKELEKTLLQIPPPKPPPPEMNFMPSLSSTDFGMLMGLEEVVKFIQEISNKKPDVKYVFNPFTCVQCGTDYTPVWKRDKPGSKSVICEQCVTSNQKKALKQEHTNRLKGAFVKALQREKEIEQKLAQGNLKDPIIASVVTPPSSTSSRHSHSEKTSSSRDKSHSSSSSSAAAASSSSSSSHSAAVQAQVQAAINFQTMQQQAVAALANLKMTPDQIRQHQALLVQTQQAQLRILQQQQSLLQNPKHLAASLGTNYSPQQIAKMADLQRQFLMDMIPGLSGNQAALWKK
ncbi:unnamed protein product [Dimorphilus gyrociliatus]|uniref:GATA-type domain-containing protein n=1 Tax=Dimorphilus gyrociliatus TaxID=2664684 RepID=A0A7I8W429_9ANNE|nr:unnamed protein product [Dimorphilus gyrociliatus]